ncbi:MAG: M14-type cytosolic carboxypeptidase, partial [Bacteroidota bacterium]
MKTIVLLLLIASQIIFGQVKFDADFESGNLSTVTTTDSINYNVTTVSDIGGRWFYFRITGVKDRYIKVTITNSDVNRPMYSYDNVEFIRFTESEAPVENVFQKTFEEDTVYVAYYTPYTFSYLQERLSEWSASEYVTLDTLGFTEKNLPLQEMILTDPSYPDDEKLRVWIHARTHPGETPSSWHFDGIMQKLLEDDEVIDYYRKNIIFYLYPFNNPDGVYYGRSRTNYYGIDQERDWNFPDNETSAA